ncbi:unnamed protein product [Ceratitis capitata]|uniref:(Mediterranean fruit fly) hypothetical protein n=1 Tax=Ceratitis capitata TaxID=7213 RepID=A0A811USF8_CERCA|nr:unnamed protein product [Ceratitis capitata]
MKSILFCRDPGDLEQAMDILFQAGYAHVGDNNGNGPEFKTQSGIPNNHSPVKTPNQCPKIIEEISNNTDHTKNYTNNSDYTISHPNSTDHTYNHFNNTDHTSNHPNNTAHTNK